MKLAPWDYTKMTPEERFFSRICFEPNTGCWLWSTSTAKDGYGLFKPGPKLMTAHTWAYEHFKGPRNGLFVLHKCDTPACCNPAHLFLGTHAENMEDRHRKGRYKWSSERRRKSLNNSCLITSNIDGRVCQRKGKYEY